MGRKKKRKNRRRRSVILWVLLFCVLVAFAFLRQWYDLVMMDKEIAQWETALEQAKTEQTSLNVQKERLYDTDYIAILAREKMFIFPGEKVWLLSTKSDGILSSVETEGIIAE